MKRRIVLKIESKKGNEEYCINLPKTIWSNVINAIFQENGNANAFITNKIRKDILINSNDEDLVYYALDRVTFYLTNDELKSIFKRFKHNEDIQLMLVWYCWDKKKISILKLLQNQGVTERVRTEAKGLFK